MKSAFLKLANHPRASMGILFALPILLRLLLMPFHPAPIPAGGDDFSYLLLGDTLAHFRLANPTHPMHRFFETDFTLQEPTYSSIYPVGQGLALALGQLLFRQAWAGVLISQGLLCALCYWMLCGWMFRGLSDQGSSGREWALLGGLFAVFQFGPLNQWTNSYFGGGVSAIAGCLVFGALPRLYWRGEWNTAGLVQNSLLLGLGFGLQILTRPFEAVLLLVYVAVYFAPGLQGVPNRAWLVRAAWITALPGIVALGLTALQNHAVTGEWLKLPYVESREQYGVPTAFTFQPNPTPHRALTREQDLGYRAQSIVHGDGQDSFAKFLKRLRDRLVFSTFFIPIPLFPAILACMLELLRRARNREPGEPTKIGWPHLWAALVIVFVVLGTNFYPYFYPHYIAALSSVFILLCILGLQVLARMPVLAPALIALTAAQFVFWYGLHLSANEGWIARYSQYQLPYFITWGDPEGRLEVTRRLEASKGQDLVFVRYSPQHLFREWVRNAADIDAAPVVWARDLGAAENAELENYYSDRTVWLLEPDRTPPLLRTYRLTLEQDPFTFLPSTGIGKSVTEPHPPSAKPAQPGAARDTEPAQGVSELPDSGWLIKKK